MVLKKVVNFYQNIFVKIFFSLKRRDFCLRVVSRFLRFATWFSVQPLLHLQNTYFAFFLHSGTQSDDNWGAFCIRNSGLSIYQLLIIGEVSGRLTWESLSNRLQKKLIKLQKGQFLDEYQESFSCRLQKNVDKVAIGSGFG